MPYVPEWITYADSGYLVQPRARARRNGYRQVTPRAAPASADAGMVTLLRQHGTASAEAGPAAAEITGGLEIQVGHLAAAINHQLAFQRMIAEIDAQSVAPVDLGPLDFTITSGQPKLKSHRSTVSDNMSPQEGYVWFVTRVSLAGLNAGDIVNLMRPTASGILTNSSGVHTFTAPSGVAAGSGIADWEPGIYGMVLRPDDTFNLQSGGTLLASEIILTGQAIQVAVPYLALYLL